MVLVSLSVLFFFWRCLLSNILFCFQITAADIIRIAPVVAYVLNHGGQVPVQHQPMATSEPIVSAPEVILPVQVSKAPDVAPLPLVDQEDVNVSSVSLGSDTSDVPVASDDSPQATKLTRMIFNQLKIIFPHKFKDNDVPESLPPGVMMFKKDINVPKLCVKPVISGTWLDPPNKAKPSDIVGYWPSGTTFPKNASSTPAKYRWNPPKRPIDTCYVDPKLEAFIDGPILGESVLDPYAFSNPSCNVKGSHQACMDRLLRSCLHKSFLGSEFITMLLEMIPLIKSEIIGQLPDSGQVAEDRSFPTLDLLHNLLGLLAHGRPRKTNT